MDHQRDSQVEKGEEVLSLVEQITSKGDNGRVGGNIMTFTGKIFYPLDPRPEEIEIVDIAHALAMQCRYAGHCKFHYSVAQHSYLLSGALSMTHEDLGLWGLLHDASEAYLGDFIRPLKELPEFGKLYRDAERKLLITIAEKYGLSLDHVKEGGRVEPDAVVEADNKMLYTEKRVLCHKQGIRREYETDYYPEMQIREMTPYGAEDAFMSRFKILTGRAR